MKLLNVLVSRDGDVKIADFGIAKVSRRIKILSNVIKVLNEIA